MKILISEDDNKFAMTINLTKIIKYLFIMIINIVAIYCCESFIVFMVILFSFTWFITEQLSKL